MLVFIVFMILQSYRKSNCFTHSGTPSLCALPYDKHVIIDWSEFFMILEPLERVDTKKQMMNHRFQRREKMHNITIARFSHPWNALIRRNEWWIVDFKGVKTASYNLLWSCHIMINMWSSIEVSFSWFWNLWSALIPRNKWWIIDFKGERRCITSQLQDSRTLEMLW